MLKSKIYGAVFDYDCEKTCTLHRVDIDNNGVFTNPGPIVAPLGQEAVIWDQLIHEKVAYNTTITDDSSLTSL